MSTFLTARARRDGWAELLALVGHRRHLAYDCSLDDADRTRRLRDRFDVYNGILDGDGN